MPKQLQVFLIVISILVLFFIVRFIKKSKLSTQMAVIWILWSIGLILISCFPQIVYRLSDFLGIQTPMNTLFLIMMFILYCLVFFLYLRISILENKLKAIAQHIGIDEFRNSKRESK